MLGRLAAPAPAAAGGEEAGAAGAVAPGIKGFVASASLPCAEARPSGSAAPQPHSTSPSSRAQVMASAAQVLLHEASTPHQTTTWQLESPHAANPDPLRGSFPKIWYGLKETKRETSTDGLQAQCAL